MFDSDYIPVWKGWKYLRMEVSSKNLTFSLFTTTFRFSFESISMDWCAIIYFFVLLLHLLIWRSTVWVLTQYLNLYPHTTVFFAPTRNLYRSEEERVKVWANPFIDIQTVCFYDDLWIKNRVKIDRV